MFWKEFRYTIKIVAYFLFYYLHSSNTTTLKKLLLALVLLSTTVAFSQNYQATNEISLFIKEKNVYRVFYSKNLFVKVNMDAAEFSFQVEFPTFKTFDTANHILLTKIFPLATSPFIVFKGALPFNQLDKDISFAQTVNIIGNFAVAGQTYQSTIPVEFKFQDKQLLFDTFFNLDLSKLNIALPAEYQNRINNVFLFRIDNGHFLKRE